MAVTNGEGRNVFANVKGVQLFSEHIFNTTVALFQPSEIRKGDSKLNNIA